MLADYFDDSDESPGRKARILSWEQISGIINCPLSRRNEDVAVASYRGQDSHCSESDSFHVASAKRYFLPLLTSDAFIINHAEELGISTENLSEAETLAKN